MLILILTKPSNLITELRVVIIPETVLSEENTTEKDRKEIEKLINIFRSSFSYIPMHNAERRP